MALIIYKVQETIFCLLQVVVILLLLLNITFYTEGIIRNQAQKPLPYYPPPFTADLLRKAYNQYADYHENHMNIDRYIQSFPLQNYFVHQIEEFAYFYLDHKPDTIKSQLIHNKRWEKNVLNYMAKYIKKNSNVLDIGAHIGTHTIYFAKLLGGTGTVYAFEPQKKIFMELNTNLYINKAHHVKTLRYAVGDKAGTIEMNPSVQGNEGGTSVGQGGDKADLVTIDSLHIPNISFIKIDVEHYEDHVLDGAINTIKTNKPVILCEIMGGTSLSKSTPEIEKKIHHTIAKINELGYTVLPVGVSDFLAVPFEKNLDSDPMWKTIFSNSSTLFDNFFIFIFMRQ